MVPELPNYKTQPIPTITTIKRSKNCKWWHSSFKRGKLLLKIMGLSSTKNLHYQNKGYNQCLNVSLELIKHQIITNYDDLSNKRENPQMSIPNWHKEKIKLSREGRHHIPTSRIILNYDCQWRHCKILEWFRFKWLYSLWWSMIVLLNSDCRWQQWKQMYHFISRWRCDISLSFNPKALCPLFLPWPQTAQ